MQLLTFQTAKNHKIGAVHHSGYDLHFVGGLNLIPDQGTQPESLDITGFPAFLLFCSLIKKNAGSGHAGVAERLEQMTDELRACLSRTGAKDIRSIDPDVIRYI